MTAGTWSGSGTHVGQGAVIEVEIETGSKLWVVHSQGGKDEVVFTGQGDKM